MTYKGKPVVLFRTERRKDMAIFVLASVWTLAIAAVSAAHTYL